MPQMPTQPASPGELFLTLAVAMALGLLVGLQRQYQAQAKAGDEPAHAIAGFRTFPLISILGAICAVLAPAFGAWIVGAGLLAVCALTIMGNIMCRDTMSAGLTTEMAIIVMYVVGVLCVTGPRELAVATTVVVAALLQLKATLHDLVRRLSDSDIRAILRFGLITFVILPLLPDRTYGPYEVLNPYRIWLMVVLVVGISLAGYVVYRLVGGRRGALLAGILGGIISSTATTVSCARLSRLSSLMRQTAVPVILLATAVMYARVIVLISVVAPEEAVTLATPFAILLGVTLVTAILCLSMVRGTMSEDLPHHRNPAQMRAALVFGGLYAIVLFLVAAAREHVGDAGIITVAALSGLTDMDAITLSSARMTHQQLIDADLTIRSILLASIVNLFAKVVIVALMGDRRLALRLLVWAVPTLATSIVLYIL